MLAPCSPSRSEDRQEPSAIGPKLVSVRDSRLLPAPPLFRPSASALLLHASTFWVIDRLRAFTRILHEDCRVPACDRPLRSSTECWRNLSALPVVGPTRTLPVRARISHPANRPKAGAALLGLLTRRQAARSRLRCLVGNGRQLLPDILLELLILPLPVPAISLVWHLRNATASSAFRALARPARCSVSPRDLVPQGRFPHVPHLLLGAARSRKDEQAATSA